VALALTATILCVDDTPANLTVLDEMLRTCDFGTVCVASGAEALEQIRNQRFDMVLMDIFMPGMNGIEAMKLIRGLPAPTSSVPVIAVTADQSRGRAQFLAFGFDGFLPKPISMQPLLVEMMNVLARSKGLPRLRRPAGAANAGA
jgi:CheY-like chemotaxis protein